MGKINILQPDVFNMISAGEVVERPASVVKELVENSIDAGATVIDVTVSEGGIRRISVSDNGGGIAKEDMRAAFLPHATSKLKEISDLDTVSTLGFRGEALASIASVSEVTAISRAIGADTAAEIRLTAGKVVYEGENSRSEGTVITVDNLFFNTPARLKFLKKPSTEQAYIRETVEKIALANPTVRLTLSAEDGVIIRNEGGTLRDAVAAVYPSLDTARFLEVNRTSSSGIAVRGFVSEVDYTAPTRARQTAIVNGRVVESDTVTTAVEKAYKDFLVKRTYPMFVLDILVPFEEVDVNVHPAKTEVRFRNRNAVFGAVFRAVDEALKQSLGDRQAGFGRLSAEESSVRPAVSLEQIAIDAAAFYDIQDEAKNERSDPDSNARHTVYDVDSSDSRGTDAVRLEKKPFDISAFERLSPYGKRSRSFAAEKPVGAYAVDRGVTDSAAELASSMDSLFATETAIAADEDFANSSAPRFLDFDGVIVGQVFSTYLIVERKDCVYIIDQHAAHERVLYDKLMSSLSAEYSQGLILPYKKRFSGAEEEYLEKLMPALNEMGFDIEKKDGWFYVYAMPAPVVKMDFDKFLGLLFENMLDDGELNIRSLLRETVSREACRAAIKGGETLTRRQIQYVLSNLIDEDGNLPASCPHGRPAVVKLTRKDFEKMFKRIVR